MDIMLAGEDQSQPISRQSVGIVEQAEQPNYPAEGQTPCNLSYFYRSFKPALEVTAKALSTWLHAN
eukprot:533017-Pelagomonas_calceolata.AAC.1